MAPTNSPVRSHRDLVVWQRAMKLIEETYRLTDGFPKREMYGLVAQMRTAAVSIPANIAEGQARPTTRDYLRFLGIAAGSLRELQTYYEISLLLNYATEVQLKPVCEIAEETGKLLTRLREALRARTALAPLSPEPGPLPPPPA